MSQHLTSLHLSSKVLGKETGIFLHYFSLLKGLGMMIHIEVFRRWRLLTLGAKRASTGNRILFHKFKNLLTSSIPISYKSNITFCLFLLQIKYTHPPEDPRSPTETNDKIKNHGELSSWLMQPECSMPHSQQFSNNPYHESNPPNPSYWHLFL